jgi:hypothetical protein
VIILKTLGKGAALTLFLAVATVSFSASYDLSLLQPGKSWSGKIAAFTQHKIPATQDVTLRIDKITGSEVTVNISWSKFSSGEGEAGSKVYKVQIGELGGLPQLSIEGEKYMWEFTFKSDGTVNCRAESKTIRTTRTGVLK